MSVTEVRTATATGLAEAMPGTRVGSVARRYRRDDWLLALTFLPLVSVTSTGGAGRKAWTEAQAG